MTQTLMALESSGTLSGQKALSTGGSEGSVIFSQVSNATRIASTGPSAEIGILSPLTMLKKIQQPGLQILELQTT